MRPSSSEPGYGDSFAKCATCATISLWCLLRACTRCRRSEVWSAVDWVNTGEMS